MDVDSHTREEHKYSKVKAGYCCVTFTGSVFTIYYTQRESDCVKLFHIQYIKANRQTLIGMGLASRGILKGYSTARFM